MGEFIGDKSVSRSSQKKQEPKKENRRSEEPKAKSASPQTKKTSTKSTASKSASSKQGSSKNSAKQSPAKNGPATKSSSKKSGTAYKNSTGASDSKRRTSSPVSENYDKYERDLHNSQYAKELSRNRRIRAYKRNSALRSFLLYFSVAAAVIAVTVILSTTVLFNIETINVEIVGEVPYTQEEILANSGLQQGQNMFTPSVFVVADELKASMPYIENCTLKRKLPSGITIVVEGAEILGVLQAEDGISYVVGVGGRALEIVTVETNISHLTKVSGINIMGESVIGRLITVDDANRLEAMSLLVSLFAQHDMHLDTISFNESGELFATYDERLQFVFGLPTGLESKVTLAATLINTGKITENEGGRLDLSISGEATFTPDYLLAENI